MTTVGFPGLGIEVFSLNRIIFSVGPFALHWYGLIIAVGFFAAAFYGIKRAQEFGFKPDTVIDLLLFCVPMSIIGARLYYVMFDWPRYQNDPLAMLRIWDGGLAIYGAIIFAVLTCVLFCWVQHYSGAAMLDLGSLGLLIGQAVGRWGNFVNGEVFGVETDLPWAMSIRGQLVHPLFLYECLWNLAGFVILHFVSKKRKFNGQIFLMYVAWYGLGRGLLEGLRTGEYSLMLGSVRVSQMVAFASFVIALLVLFYQLVLRSHEPEDLLAWVDNREAWLASRGPVMADGFAEGSVPADGHEGETESQELDPEEGQALPDEPEPDGVNAPDGNMPDGHNEEEAENHGD